ncbi:hypothetical protein NM208_g9685 [Fusarium decemcellulare]|uniref:Uncharacterized protein n=1 Tax=Fusarium decemcellulare TaxID=57161 RepID=A0ACC1S0Q0_9HYPO|nr:hypothetical protein NM208_g9685 [Fusarium decemcellulare]
MCYYCDQAGRWLTGCLNGNTPSPPRAPAYPMQAPTYTAQAYVSQPRPVAASSSRVYYSGSNEHVSQSRPVTASSSRVYYSGSNEHVPHPQPVTASSSGNFYPGSHYPGSYNERPVDSPRSSISSTRSIELAESTLERIRTSRSIRALARQISRDLGDLDGTVEDLQAAFDNTDPTGYKKREPWSQGMERAYSRYKRFEEEYPLSKVTYHTATGPVKKNATPEERIERARLALDWASSALRAAEARLEFMKTYRDAYEHDGIMGHIGQGQQDINSARDAIEEARINYNSKQFGSITP